MTFSFEKSTGGYFDVSFPRTYESKNAAEQAVLIATATAKAEGWTIKKTLISYG